MLDAFGLNIITASIPSATAGTAAWRGLFAQAAASQSQGDEQSRIKRAFNDLVSQNLGALPPDAQKGARLLYDVGKLGNKVRAEALNYARKVSIPTSLEVRREPEVMRKSVIAIGALAASYSISVAQYKVASVLSQDVQRNLAKDVAQQAPVRDVIDDHISSALKELGITDVVTDIVAQLGAIHIPHALSQFIMDVAAVPGIAVILRTGAQELSLLYNDKTTLKDTVLLGAVPASVLIGGMKAGAVAGAGLGSSFGRTGAALGTIIGGLGGWLAGHVTKEKIIEGVINADRAKLKPYIEKIKEHKLNGVQQVNKIIVDEFGDFNRDIEVYPHLHEGTSACVLTERLVEALEKDASAFARKIRQGHMEMKSGLSQGTWLDRIFLTNKPAQAAEECRTVAKAIIDDYRRKVADFSTLLRSDFEAAGRVLKDGQLPVVRDGAFLPLLQRLRTDMMPVLKEYDERRADWSHALGARWADGNRRVQLADIERIERLEEVVAVFQPEMAPIQERIRVNEARLGR